MKKLILITAILCGMVGSQALAAEDSARLMAVQLYADWCQSCKALAPSYEALQEVFQDEVLFLRWDRTNDQTAHQAWLLAQALGLGDIYQKYEGTGKVLLIDGRTHMVLGTLTKDQSLDEMKALVAAAVGHEKSEEKGSPAAMPKGSGREQKGSGVAPKGSGHHGSMKKGS